MAVKRVIYSESQEQFFDDVRTNRYMDKMLEAAQNYSLGASRSEIRSWGVNASKVKDLLELSGLSDTFVTFEYLIPYRQSRVDCVIYGRNSDNRGAVFHLELKQWGNDSVTSAESAGNFNIPSEEEEENLHEVKAVTGGKPQMVAHPSQQVKGYHGYMEGFVEVLGNKELELYGAAYCYNYRRSEQPCDLYHSQYEKLLQEYYTYSGDEIHDLAAKLKQYLVNGDGKAVFNKMISSPIRPSKKLLESAANLIHEGNLSAFSLIEDQLAARNTILNAIRKISKRNKSVILVKGGPGTGKTVIALNILATLAGRCNSVHYATKSKSLLEGLKYSLPRGSEAKKLFSNIAQFIPARFQENELQVLLIDEAHRIESSPNHQHTKSEHRTNLTQIESIIRTSRVTVFFIDDKQVIRSKEIGSSELIRESAKKYNAKVEEVQLVSQFRCNGSDNYLDWIEQVLYNKEITSGFADEEFEFRIFDDPVSLYEQIRDKDSRPGMSARLTAGFCWPWSKTVDENGELIKDVRVGELALPWKTHDDIWKSGRMPAGYVRWYEWAYKPEGIKQVGCIYTAQGFEFDYIGVIVGEDLIYSPEENTLVTDINAIEDPTLKKNAESFDTYVRNIYRVLMSRGMKGCYLYFVDKGTERHFRSCLKKMIKDQPSDPD